jgi:hypothetical protein
MAETRVGRYGRNLAIWIEYTINTLPQQQRSIYTARFLKELKTYSFKSKRKEQPPNEGCVHELSDLICVDVKKPQELAKLVKESMHLLYQKETSARVLIALLEYLESRFGIKKY